MPGLTQTLFVITDHINVGNAHASKYIIVTVSGKTTLLAEIEKVGFLLSMDSINTRLCCSTRS